MEINELLSSYLKKMLNDDFFSVYENEKRRPGLIANGIMRNSNHC